MPRAARRTSSTGIYHILLAGTPDVPLFREDEDCVKFLGILRECRDLSQCEIYAYCLTDGLIHLLLKEGAEPLANLFKRIGGRYVYWYNLKYHRTGPLFQGRYRSDPVEDESHFLTVLHFIHRKPAQLGLETSPGEYPWSSYRCYAGWPDGITDTSFASDLIGNRAELLRFFSHPGESAVLDAPPARREGVTDETAIQLLTELSGCRSEAEFQSLPRSVREVCLRELYRRQLSLRQLARISGLSKATVYRLVN